MNAPVIAHHEGRFGPAVALHREAHAFATFDDVRGFADQANASTHCASSAKEETQASGVCSTRSSRGWAPYATATASTSALRAINRSCVVSPIISVRVRSTPIVSIRYSSMSGCGFGSPSSAQRDAWNIDVIWVD